MLVADLHTTLFSFSFFSFKKKRGGCWGEGQAKSQSGGLSLPLKLL